MTYYNNDGWGIVDSVIYMQFFEEKQASTWVERQRLFRQLAKLIHPDKCPHPMANEAFSKVREALVGRE